MIKTGGDKEFTINNQHPGKSARALVWTTLAKFRGWEERGDEEQGYGCVGMVMCA